MLTSKLSNFKKSLHLWWTFRFLPCLSNLKPTHYFQQLFSECKNHLLQPELMLMLSTGRILEAAALGSDLCCAQIVKTTTPLLIETYNKQTQVWSCTLKCYFISKFCLINSSECLRKKKYGCIEKTDFDETVSFVISHRSIYPNTTFLAVF